MKKLFNFLAVTFLFTALLSSNVFAQVPERSRLVVPSSTSTSWFRAATTPTDCSAPQFSFTGDTNTGISYGGAADSFHLCTTGIARVGLYSGEFQLKSDAVLTWSTGAIGSSSSVVLARDADHVFAQRNGTNAQTFRIYNTTDAGLTNYERARFTWSSNEFFVGTEQGGTGSARAMSFQTNGTRRWTINESGHFIAGIDNTYDIGASGATRPRNIYAGTGFLTTNVNITTTSISITNGVGTEIFFTGAPGANIASDTALTLLAGAASALDLGAGGTNSIARITSAGLIFPTDNTYDIGASGNNRPRNIFAAGTLTLGFNNPINLSWISDGVGMFTNNAGTGFTRFIYGTNDTTGNGASVVKDTGGHLYFRRGDGSTGTLTVANVTSNSCGTTAATISGTDYVFAVTVGATSGTRCRVTFVAAWETAPRCFVNNSTTANLARADTSTTTTVDLAGTFVGGDVLWGFCFKS